MREQAIFSSGTGDAFVVRTQDAEHPVYLAAYMSGGEGDFVSKASFGARGDPDFVNVVATGQYMSTYSFFADPTYAETSLVIVRAKQNGRFEDVWLECAGNLGAAKGDGDVGFRPVGTRGEYEFARVDLSKNRKPGDTFGDRVCRTGLQQMRSEGPFTATLWGWDKAVSYAYPGGMAQRKLVDTPLVPVR
jgi:IgGFc binding protein